MMMYDLCVYNMIGCARVFTHSEYFIIIYCGAVELWGNANTHLQGLSKPQSPGT